MKKIFIFLSLVISFVSLQAQREKTTFFKLNAEIPVQSSLDLSGLSRYYSQDNSVIGLKKNGEDTIDVHPVGYRFTHPIKKTSQQNFSVEYWRLNKDFDFLIGVGQNNLKTKTKSSLFASESIDDFIYEKSTWKTTTLGAGLNGSFETKNQDIYVGVPFYLKDLLIIPKIMDREHKLNFGDSILGSLNGSWDEVIHRGSVVSGNISGSSGSFFSLKAEAKIRYKGLSLEKKLNEKVDFVLDYLTSGKSKGSYTFFDIRTGNSTITFPATYLKDDTISYSGFEFTKGSYTVTGKKLVLGFKYKYKPNLNLYLKKVQETFETSFSPMFILYNLSSDINIDGRSRMGTVDEVNPQEALTDFVIWNTKSKIKIDDWRFGVSYKL